MTVEAKLDGAGWDINPHFRLPPFEMIILTQLFFNFSKSAAWKEFFLKFERKPRWDLWNLEHVTGVAWSEQSFSSDSSGNVNLNKYLKHRSAESCWERCSWALRWCSPELIKQLEPLKGHEVSVQWCPGSGPGPDWSTSVLPSSPRCVLSFSVTCSS